MAVEFEQLANNFAFVFFQHPFFVAGFDYLFLLFQFPVSFRAGKIFF